MELFECQEPDSPPGSPLLCLAWKCFSLLRQIKFVPLVALGTFLKSWNILGGIIQSRTPQKPHRIHLCEADTPQMGQGEGIQLFSMELRDFFAVKTLFTGMVLPHFPSLSLLDGLCGKAAGNSMVPFSTVAQGIKSIFLPTTSLSPSEL